VAEGGSSEHLQESEKRAWEKLQGADFAERSRAAGARLIEGNLIEVPFLKGKYIVATPSRTFKHLRLGEPSPTRRLLLLHYLIFARQYSLTGKAIGFAEIPRASGLIKLFQRRVIWPLLRRFAEDVKEMSVRAEALGGLPLKIADASARLYPFPRIPLTLAIWRGDEEHQAEAQAIFDSSVAAHLPAEDIVLLARETVEELLSHESRRKEKG